jgi:hypothetical protein
MKQSEKLQKVIEKAESNGYIFWNVDPKHITLNIQEGIFKYKKGASFYASVSEVIFSHDFAKAFWGDEEIDRSCAECGPTIISLGWQYHIQKLALTPEDERINYLYTFI